MLIYFDDTALILILMICIIVSTTAIFGKVLGWDSIIDTISDFIVTYAQTYNDSNNKNSKK